MSATEVDVRKFYETFPYPPREEDLDGFRDGTHIAEGSPRHWFHLYFPERAPSEDLEVLVAGCGMYQAARFALLNPRTPITAIDISHRALDSTRQLKEKYTLGNLEIQELPIEEVSRLNRRFDLIYSTGVLHHLADPFKGLDALRGVLDPRGSLDLMVYGTYGRTALDIMQKLLRHLSVEADGKGVERARRWIDALPSDHPFRNFASRVRDVHFREGLADLLLNPRERSYTVPEIFGLLKGAGLVLQRFFYQAYYLPSSGPLAGSSFRAGVERLPLEEQYAIGELARASLMKHDFVACSSGRAETLWRPDFSSQPCLQYIPSFFPGAKITPGEDQGSATATIAHALHDCNDLAVPLEAKQLRLLEAIDGKRDVSAIVEAVGATGYTKTVDAATRQFLRSMWEHDFLLFQMPPNEKSPKPASRKGHAGAKPVRPAVRPVAPATAGPALPEKASRLLTRLNVGCGRNIRSGWLNLDVARLPGVDIVADLERCAEVRLPLPDDTIEEFLLSHVVEHIQNVLPLMQELHRVAKPGARAVIRVPYGSSDDAFEDPTHVRQFFVNSFTYFSQPCYWRADYGYRGDWSTKQITLVVDRKTHQNMAAQEILQRVSTLRNVVGR